MATRLPQHPAATRRLPPPRRGLAAFATHRIAASARAALVMGLALGAAGALVSPAQAQPAARPVADGARNFSIPAGPLDRALGGFASAAGIELSVDASLLQGRNTTGLAGSFTVGDGFAELLRGHGLQAVRQPNGSYTLGRSPVPAAGSASASPNATAGGTVLPVVTVQAAGPQETATGPVQGYVAKRSASATKTDTSLLETPQLINVVTRAQMDDQGARTVAEALRYTAGVLAEPNGFDVRYDWNYIRGYNTFGTQWLDGLPMPGDPSSYAVPRIPAYGLERVEVIKGPASVLYGKSIPGGLLNQVSKRPQAEAHREVQVTATNFGGAQVATDLTGPIDKDGQWLYRLVALRRDAHTQVDHERDTQTMIAPSFTWRPSAATSLTLQMHYQKDDPRMSPRFYPVIGSHTPSKLFGYIPRSLYLGEPSTDSFNRTYKSIGYAFEHRFNDTFAVRQNLRYGHAEQDMFLVRVHPFNAYRPDGHTMNRVSAISDDDIRSLSVDTQVEAKVRTGPLEHTLLAGVDHLRGKISFNFANSAVGVPSLDVLNPVYGLPVTRPTAYTTSNLQQLQQTGLYLQDQIRWGRAIATLGLRHDRSSIDTTNRTLASRPTVATDDSATTGRAGLTYVFDNGIAPYASYSTSFLPTSGVDRLNRPFQAQKGRQFEVGVKYEPEGGWGFMTASLFRNELENGLTPDGLNAQYSVQTGRQRLRGLELEAKADLTSRLSLIAAYSYTDSEVRASNDRVALGQDMLRTPRHQASAWMDYRFESVPGLQAGIGARYMSAYDTAPTYDPALRIPSLFLWDLGASYDLGMLSETLKGARLRLTIANVSDKRYVSHCLMSNGSPCNYGARRTATATLSYAW